VASAALVVAPLAGLLHVGRRQLRDGFHFLISINTDDANRTARVKRFAIACVEGTVILAPAFGAFFVGDPQAPRKIIRDGGAAIKVSGRTEMCPGEVPFIGKPLCIASTDVVIPFKVAIIKSRPVFARSGTDAWRPIVVTATDGTALVTVAAKLES